MAKAKTKQRGLPPNAALDASKQKEFNQKVQAAKEKGDSASPPGVVYISRLPWGFEEEPMKSFFSQFGTINKLRVSRSKRTGNSRGYAYIQFANDEVAKIVAESMNNYLMFEKLIKCKHLTTVHPDTFKNAGKTFRKFTTQEKAIMKHNRPKSAVTLTRNTAQALSKYRKKKNKLAELGIDYQLDCLEKVPMVKKIKEEIFSDDDSQSNKDEKKTNKRQKASRKSETNVTSTDTAKKRKSVSETIDIAKKDIVDVSEEDTDEKQSVAKSSHTKHLHKTGAKRKSVQTETSSKTLGKKQKRTTGKKK